MRLLGLPIPGVLVDLVIGLFALVTLPWVTRGLAAIHVGLGRGLLSLSRQSLERRVAQLSQARDQLGKAETDSLRRLERDIHDGPQQTLIRMGMDLAAAERRLAEGDVVQAQALLGGTRHMNDLAIGELRSLSRSIAPPILAERGLHAALVAVGATSTIPVHVRYELGVEPPQATATAAYYVACEALANAAKHSGASQVDLFLGTDDNDNLLMEVCDNGRGGAIAIPGHGLSGLADRVGALDGTLSVTGTPGTTVRVVLPL